MLKPFLLDGCFAERAFSHQKMTIYDRAINLVKMTLGDTDLFIGINQLKSNTRKTCLPHFSK